MRLRCQSCQTEQDVAPGGAARLCCKAPRPIRVAASKAPAAPAPAVEQAPAKGPRKRPKTQVAPVAPGRIAFTVPGPPRTKKNSLRRKMIGGQLKTLPSEAWCAWRDKAKPEIQRWRNEQNFAQITWQVNCRALFFRAAAAGDAVGFYQGLADLLEEAGILADDKQIVSWDGSRLEKDARNPRVEVVLSWPVGGARGREES